MIACIKTTVELERAKAGAEWNDLLFLRMQRDALFNSIDSNYSDITEDLEDMCRGWGGWGKLRNLIVRKAGDHQAAETLDVFKELCERIQDIERTLISQPILVPA